MAMELSNKQRRLVFGDGSKRLRVWIVKIIAALEHHVCSSYTY